MYPSKRRSPALHLRFPDIKEYLDQTFGLLDAGLQNTVREEEKNNSYHHYKLIDVGPRTTTPRYWASRLRTKDYKVVPKESGNDFIIESTKNAPGLRPCVLPTEPFNEQLGYAGGVWQRNFHQNVPILR